VGSLLWRSGAGSGLPLIQSMIVKEAARERFPRRFPFASTGVLRHERAP